MSAQMAPQTIQPLVDVRRLSKHFAVRRGPYRKLRLQAVDDVSFTLDAGEVLGIVGESGCGKSTVARVVVGLLRADEGTIRVGTDEISARDMNRVNGVRGTAQMVFQDSFASLNPRLTLTETVAFTAVARGVSRKPAKERAHQLLAAVGLDPATFSERYPHEVSGGQRQRVNIARALAGEPRVLVLDEAVSALDKSVEAQVLNLLQDLKKRLGLTYLFISHDLHVVRYMSDRIAVMYLGRIVEFGAAEAIIASPKHPYTRALIDAIPTGDAKRRIARPPLEGDPPSAIAVSRGCRFRDRCPRSQSLCAEAEPTLRPEGGHLVACHFPL